MKLRFYALFAFSLFFIGCGNKANTENTAQSIGDENSKTMATSSDAKLITDNLPPELKDTKWVEVCKYDNQYWVMMNYAPVDQMVEVAIYGDSLKLCLMEPIDFEIKDVDIKENGSTTFAISGFIDAQFLFDWVDKEKRVATWKIQDENGNALYNQAFDKLAMELENIKKLELKTIPTILLASTPYDIKNKDRDVTDIDLFLNFHFKNDGNPHNKPKNFYLDYNKDGLKDRVCVFHSHDYVQDEGYYKIIVAKQNANGSYYIDYINTTYDDGDFAYTDKITLDQNENGFKCKIGDSKKFENIPIFEYTASNQQFMLYYNTSDNK